MNARSISGAGAFKMGTPQINPEDDGATNSNEHTMHKMKLAIKADRCGLMLTNAHQCTPMRTNADGWGLMQTIADQCRPMQTNADRCRLMQIMQTNAD